MGIFSGVCRNELWWLNCCSVIIVDLKILREPHDTTGWNRDSGFGKILLHLPRRVKLMDNKNSKVKQRKAFYKEVINTP